MNLRVLGPLEVVGPDGPVPLPGTKHRRLLAALTLTRGTVWSIDRLADAIWGSSPPASAPKLVQVYVSQLRKVLPPAVSITTAPGGYRLDIPAELLDVAPFETLVADGRDALSEGNALLATSLLDRALALWRGPAYADFAYEEFAAPEARRLDELRLVAIEARNEALLQSGRHDALLPELRRLAAEHPLRESIHGQLMRALHGAGMQAEALETYRSLYDRMTGELGVEPSGALRRLEQQVLSQDPTLLPAAGAGGALPRLPAPASPLRGRDRELRDLTALLARPEVRMVVLVGSAGSGKTRLALEAARHAASNYANGAAFVELAPMADASLVPTAFARALGLPEPDGLATESLAATIRSYELLVVLDSAEHVPAAWVSFVELLAAVPRLTLMVTSRRVMHVSGEHVFPVSPLDEDAAIALFIERARAVDPSFDAAGNERAIVEICRRLDALPLAIELAAARTNALSITELQRLLASRLNVLTVGPRDLPARQQTLRDTLAWSVDLLSGEGRAALAGLSAFAGAWTLDAAGFVAGATLDVISELVDHSLVQRRDATSFGMLDIVREFATEMLDQSSEAGAVRSRHARWAIQTAEAAEAELGGPDQASWLDRMEAMHDDVRLAERMLADTEPALALRLAAAIGRFRYVRGYLAEARASLERALGFDDGTNPDARAKALRVASAVGVLQGDWPVARAFAEEGLSLYRASQDRQGVARSLSNLGAILIGADEPASAAATLDEAIVLARELGDARILALSLNNRGDVALTQHEWLAAEAFFAESLGLLRSIGDEANVARSLFNLAAATLESGRMTEAAELLGESLRRSVQLGDREDIAWCMLASAAIAERQGDPRTGAMLLGAAEGMLSEMGAAFKPYERRLHARTSEALLRTLGHDDNNELRARGRSLPLAEAIELASDG